MNSRYILSSAKTNALELLSSNTATSKESTNDKRERGDMSWMDITNKLAYLTRQIDDKVDRHESYTRTK